MERSLNSNRKPSMLGSPSSYSVASTAAPRSSRDWTEKSFCSPDVNWTSPDIRLWETSSRTWTARRSTRSPLGELSPSCQSLVNHMRRSMSFERIGTSSLAGKWPRTVNLRNTRQNLLQSHFVLTADKWTQTTDDLDSQDCGGSDTRVHSKPPLSSQNDNRKNKMLFEMPERLAHMGNGFTLCNDQMSIVENELETLQKKADGGSVVCHRKATGPCQNNTDGFNLEVEKLIQYTGVLDAERGCMKNAHILTPDGHRAPIAEMLSMGCPNGRMLSGSPFFSNSENHFVRIPEDTSDGAPSLPTKFHLDGSTTVSFHHSLPARRTSGMFQCPKNVIVSPSPIVYKSLRKRQAPEGSDVENQMVVDIRSDVYDDLASRIKISSASRFSIPSEHSAFCPLLRKYVSKKSLLKMPVPPSGPAEEIQ